MKIVIVNGSLGGNIGDNVILFNTIDEIKKINPVADISYDEPIWDYKLTIDNFWETVDEAISNPINDMVKQKIKNIRDADLIIAVGGGYLCDWNVTFYNNMVITKLFEAAIALRFKKRVYFCAHTVEIYKRALEPILINVLSQSVVTVREPNSWAYLANIGVSSELTGDMAFLTDITRANKQQKQDLIGVCLRGDRPIKYKEWELILADLKKVEFFTSTYGQDAKRFHLMGQNIPIAPKCENFIDVCSQISKYKFIITDRFHIVIAAMLMNIPYIPMPSINWKLQGLINMSLGTTLEELKEMAKYNVILLKELMK